MANVQQPRDSLMKLVEYVFDHRDGLIDGVTYQMLATWIGRLNKHGVGHAHWASFLEYPLPTCDQTDVLFKSPSDCIAVEVKSSVSDGYPFDHERGLYQTVKYAALLKAMAAAGGYSIPANIESIGVGNVSLGTIQAVGNEAKCSSNRERNAPSLASLSVARP